MSITVSGRCTNTFPIYHHIDPSRGNISVSNIFPVVIMKKIKLGPSNSTVLGSLTDFLPELEDADEIPDLESQKRGEKEKSKPGQKEEITFINTLNQKELNDHIQTCLQMSSENKINQKNAFALQLIDCMNFLLEQKKDFSTMACTLDASAKIYSCRVDALHQQVMKLAEEIVLNIRERAKKNEDAKIEENSSKELRKARKGNLIAPAKTLNRKPRGKDPKDKYVRFKALPGVILSSARRDAIDLSLSLEFNTPFWPNKERLKPIKAIGCVTLPDVKIFRENSQIDCSDSAQEVDQKTKIGSYVDGADNLNSEEGPVSQELFTPIDMSELYDENYEENRSFSECMENDLESANKCETGEVNVISTAMERFQAEANAGGTGSKTPTRVEAIKMLFDLTSEYDYLKMDKVNYWAGPEFWKRPKGRTDTCKENIKIPRKKKVPKEILFGFEDLDKSLKILSKKTTCLVNRTLENWKHKKTTLPEDLKFDAFMFLNLFHVERSERSEEESIGPKKPPLFVDVLTESDEIQDSSNNRFDTSSSQDPLDATFYEVFSGRSTSSQQENPLNSAFYDPGLLDKDSRKIIRVEVASSRTADFGESTMVPVPKMVKFEPIKYSTRPIRVDIQHLKQTMLEIILEEVAKDVSKKQENPVKFGDVLKILPGKLKTGTREDFTTAIAFTALLSLGNEYGLYFEKCEDGDILIRFNDSPPN